MKKIIAIILAMIMLLAFAGCENEGVDVVTKKAGSVTKKYDGENATTANNTSENPATEAGPAATTAPKAPTTDKPVTETIVVPLNIYHNREEGIDWFDDYTLVLDKDNLLFEFTVIYSYRMTESECEQINANYEDVITCTCTYRFSGSYTETDESMIAPSVLTSLYKEGYTNAAGENLNGNVREYLEECHNEGSVSDEVYEVYVAIFNGEWGDITDQFDPEITGFILYDDDMTFDYEADAF